MFIQKSNKTIFKLLFSLLLLIMHSIAAISQILSFSDTNLRSMQLIESQNKNYLLFFCKENYLKYDLQDQNKLDTLYYQKIDSTLDIPNIITNYKGLSIGDKVYFIENTGGGVITFKDGLFSKIDNSYSHRLQFGSTSFIHNKKIHQYGGYGFFSNRDFITYFDESNKSWELINPIKSKEIPIGTSANTSICRNNKLYIFNGSYADQYDRKKNNVLNEAWVFNFINSKWQKLGNTNLDEGNSVSKFFEFEKNIITINNNGTLSIIDVENNLVKKFKKTNFNDKINENILPIYKNDYFYCIINNGINKTVELHVRKKDDFFGDFIEEKKLYVSNKLSKEIYILLILLVCSIFVILKFFLKKNIKNENIIFKSNQLYFKNVLVELDKSEIEIIKLLLSKPDGVTTSEIMNLTETKGLNYSHNIRQKNNKINNINLKFRANLKIDIDLIVSYKSDFDHRMRIYKLNDLIS